MEETYHFSHFGCLPHLQQKSKPMSKKHKILNGPEYRRCCCQTVGCPLPIVVEAQSSHWSSEKRDYPQFKKAAIRPINSTDSIDICPQGPSPARFQGALERHNRHCNSSSDRKSLRTFSHKNSKSGCDSYHYGLPVTCRAPNKWLQMKWGRQ